MEEIAPDKQQFVCSRSFSRRLTEYRELSGALAEFSSRAAEKLRFQNSVAGHISVFIRTNPFNPNEPQYQRAGGITLPSATQDTRVIIGTANRLLKDLFREGYRYQKCGVQLSQIQPASIPDQMDLFEVAACGDAESRGGLALAVAGEYQQQAFFAIGAGDGLIDDCLPLRFSEAWLPTARERYGRKPTST